MQLTAAVLTPSAVGKQDGASSYQPLLLLQQPSWLVAVATAQHH